MNALIAAAFLFVTLIAGVVVQTNRLHTAQAEFALFKVQVETLGRDAERKAKERAAADKLNQEKTDAEAKLRETALQRDLVAARLRLARASSSVLPAPATGAASDSRLCLSRAELDRGLGDALGKLREGLIAIAETGQRGVNVATLCREWTR